MESWNINILILILHSNGTKHQNPKEKMNLGPTHSSK